MKKSVLLLVMLASVLFTGCDFFRFVAGRPTGKDIENKRIAIMKAEEDALQARLDSIRMVKEKVVSDSVAALESLKSQGVMMHKPSKLGGLSGIELEYEYHIIVGAFRERANARKLFDEASAKDYSPVLISFRNGMMAVGLCPSDRIASIESSLVKLRNEPFCPKEAWILVKE